MIILDLCVGVLQAKMLQTDTDWMNSATWKHKHLYLCLDIFKSVEIKHSYFHIFTSFPSVKIKTERADAWLHGEQCLFF